MSNNTNTVADSKLDVLMVNYKPTPVRTLPVMIPALVVDPTWEIEIPPLPLSEKTPAGISEKLLYNLESSVYIMFSYAKTLVPFETYSQGIIGVSDSDPRLE